MVVWWLRRWAAQRLRRRLGWWLSGCAGAAQEASGCLVAAQVAVQGCAGGWRWWLRWWLLDLGFGLL